MKSIKPIISASVFVLIIIAVVVITRTFTAASPQAVMALNLKAVKLMKLK